MTGIGLSPDAILDTKEGGTLRYTASAPDSPRFDSSQVLNSMDVILTQGYAKSISIGKLISSPLGYVIQGMQTVFETRKQRLRLLKQRYPHWADLNEAVGWDRTDPRFSQVHSETMRKDRGTPFVLGDTTARMIEEKLGLEIGWMDTPPTYAEVHGTSDAKAMAMAVMEAMPEDQWPKVLRLLDIFAEPEPKNGTTS